MMYRDIVINHGSDFEKQYVKTLIEGDCGVYRLIYKTPLDLTDCSIKVVCKRPDGVVISALADIDEQDCHNAVYVLSSNMYCVPGEIVMRVSLVNKSGQVITLCEITANVLKSFGDGIEEEDARAIFDEILINQINFNKESQKVIEEVKKAKDEANEVTEDTKKVLTDANNAVDTANEALKNAEDATERVISVLSDADSRYLPKTKASGEIPEITTAADTKISDYKIYGNGRQEGNPAPDNYVEIEFLGDLVTDEESEHFGKYRIETEVSNNLFDVEGFVISAGRANNIVTTDYTDFEITDTGVKVNSSMAISLAGVKNLITLSPGTYTFGFEVVNSSMAAGANMAIYNTKDYSNICGDTTYAVGKWMKKFTLSERTEIDIRFGTNAVCNFEISNIQLQYSSKLQEYRPYEKTSHIIAYLDEPLRKIGNYADYIDYKNQKVVRTIFCYKFTGKEYWNVNQSGELTVHGVFMPGEEFTLISGTKGYSTNGVFDGVSIFGTDYEHCMCFKEPVSGQIYFYPKILRSRLNDYETPTKDDFNKIYSAGTQFCCIRKELKEEDVELFSFSLKDGTNNIIFNNKIQPSNIEVEFYQNPTLAMEDLKEQNEKLVNAILSMGGNI